jgi:hypothetical protein
MIHNFKFLSWKEINGSHRLMTLFVIVLGLLNLFYGEVVPANDGFGWDGVVYREMTLNLNSMISDGKLNSYYAQRILPSLIVRSMLDLVNAPLSYINIIQAFSWYNLALLLGVSYLWKRLASHFSISIDGRWLGFAGLFLSYQSSKQSFYYPVLTDVTALFIGMLILVFYVEKRPLALLVSTIVGAFAWQVIGISGAILLIFMKAHLSPKAIRPASIGNFANSTQAFRWMWRAWLVVVFASLLGYAILFGLNIVFMKIGVLAYASKIHGLQRLITGVPSLLAVFYALALLFGSSVFFKDTLNSLMKIESRLVIFSCAAILIPWGLVRIISNPFVKNPSGISLVVELMLLPPSGKILLPLVTLFVFWGPIVALLLIKWNSFCIEARKLGPGFVFIVVLTLPLCLVAEPRFPTSAWPCFVLCAVLVMEQTKCSAKFNNGFMLLTVLLAQFWMKINLARWSGPAYENLDGFPKQIYFMHYGLWMNWWSYSLQLVLTGLCVLWMMKTLHSKNVLWRPSCKKH